MKKVLASLLMSAAVAACTPKHASFVKVDNVALGRVVIYRNGVAYYERHAFVTGGMLTVSVPRDRVDDFLKSLTVVDAISGKALPVSIPRQQEGDGTNLVMKLELPPEAKGKAEVVLTYVTESPSWKPSYRVAVGAKGKVMLEGWAIVDNTSGEDWKGVKVGVGSSSALSFKYDLWSVRTVQRETLRSNDLFAQAPPTGGATYGQAGGTTPVLAELSDSTLASEMAANSESKSLAAPAPMAALAPSSGFGGGAGVPSLPRAKKATSFPGRRSGGGAAPAARAADMDDLPSAPPPPPPPPASSKISDMARRLLGTHDQIIIEGFADRGDSDKNTASLARASRVREQLIRDGLPPDRVVAEIGRASCRERV